MSGAGWYPDPGGAPGMYRYWDGAAWSPHVSAAPASFPAAPQPPAASGGQPPMARGQQPRPAVRPAPRPAAPQPRRVLQGAAWWGLILLVVVGLVFAGNQLFRAVGFNPFGAAPNSNPTAELCPKPRLQGPLPVPSITGDGRVMGGKLSYPMLPAPWSPPFIEDRLVFGRGVFGQTVTVEPNYRGEFSWVASVVVGELVAGDGIVEPEQGMDIVARCAVGTFYDDAVVTRADRVNQAVTVDGRPGWLLETHLAFDIRGLKEKGETAIFVIVKTSEDSSSLFYASIPDSRPELLQTARQAQAQLRVEP